MRKIRPNIPWYYRIMGFLPILTLHSFQWKQRKRCKFYPPWLCPDSCTHPRAPALQTSVYKQVFVYPSFMIKSSSYLLKAGAVKWRAVEQVSTCAAHHYTDTLPALATSAHTELFSGDDDAARLLGHYRYERPPWSWNMEGRCYCASQHSNISSLNKHDKLLNGGW